MLLFAPQGVAALTPCSEPSLLALPAASGGFGSTPGSAAAGGAIRVYDALQGTEVLAEIPAHKSALVGSQGLLLKFRATSIAALAGAGLQGRTLQASSVLLSGT